MNSKLACKQVGRLRKLNKMKVIRVICKKCNSMPPIGRPVEVPKGKLKKDVNCPICGKKGGLKEIKLKIKK